MQESTCWTLIGAVARGDPGGRDEFARRYLGPVRAYLLARWQGSPHVQNADDAVQEVFLECLRPGGVIEQVDPTRAGGFRAFLYGVVRNIAHTLERRWSKERGIGGKDNVPEEAAADESSLSVVFDRAWAKSIMQQAARRQKELADQAGNEARQRVELLRLRFQEGRPIREIARLWQVDADQLHREYAKARKEFRAALLEVVAYHHPGSPREVEQECQDLLQLL
jgi:RNA polymerase sigma-70 factor (ECF subfamily)